MLHPVVPLFGFFPRFVWWAWSECLSPDQCASAEHTCQDEHPEPPRHSVRALHHQQPPPHRSATRGGRALTIPSDPHSIVPSRKDRLLHLVERYSVTGSNLAPRLLDQRHELCIGAQCECFAVNMLERHDRGYRLAVGGEDDDLIANLVRILCQRFCGCGELNRLHS